MAYKFAKHYDSPGDASKSIIAVTPSDTVDLPEVCRRLNVAAAGTVRVTTLGGDTETVYIAAGVVFPLVVTRVHATGTTATGIIGFV